MGRRHFIEVSRFVAVEKLSQGLRSNEKISIGCCKNFLAAFQVVFAGNKEIWRDFVNQ